MIKACSAAAGALDELVGLDLGDARLDARARRLVTAWARDPAAGIPSAVETAAEREAAYRLLSNRRVTLAGLVAPHIAQTAQRVAAEPTRPLVLIDKTTCVFAGESPRTGLTRLGPARHGFDLFVALAVTPTRVPLGVVALSPVTSRGRASAATWGDVVTTAHAIVGTQQPIYVMDREADAYPLMATLQAAGRDFIIRIAIERQGQADPLAAAEPLHAVVGRTAQQLTRTVPVGRRDGRHRPRASRRRYPPRAARMATLAVRACPVTLPRPRKLDATIPSVGPVQVVHVREAAPPADTAPIEWLLLTSLSITTPADVEAVIDGYRARWVIEEYFKALKTGCAYEKRQLESRTTLLAALGLLAPMAWRLLALRTAALDTALPATAVLAVDELHVLRQLARDVPLGPTPTAADAWRAIARIGGHFPSNGPPGWQVLWTGFRKLHDRVEGYRLARDEYATRCDQ